MPPNTPTTEPQTDEEIQVAELLVNGIKGEKIRPEFISTILAILENIRERAREKD